MDDKSPTYDKHHTFGSERLLRIGLSPLLHRYPKPAVRFNITGTGFPNRIILFKSLFNSQHGWIFIMVINSQYYDGVLQSRFIAMVIILSMDMIYFTMEGIVPSHCGLTTRHLGATLFKSRLHASLMSLQACIMTLGG